MIFENRVQDFFFSSYKRTAVTFKLLPKEFTNSLIKLMTARRGIKKLYVCSGLPRCPEVGSLATKRTESVQMFALSVEIQMRYHTEIKRKEKSAL